jgi:threonine/homoserine efflux transporter RhtA
VALHLWLWLASPGLRSRRPLAVAAALLGAVPVALVVAYYAHSLGLSPLGVLWTGVLLVAGGQITSLTGAFWALLAGCLTGALIIGARAAAPARQSAAGEVTVRGPVSYAGPGSLGGTESALRR